MFGCLRRIGCIVVVLVAIVALWLWYARVDEPKPTPGSTPVRIVWEPVTPEGAERGRIGLEQLSTSVGPSVANLSAGDVASYIFYATANRLPESARDIEAAVIGDRLAVRGVVSLRDIGGSRILGPLANLLSNDDTLSFSGTLTVVDREVGAYNVKQLSFGKLSIPSGLLPRVLSQIDRGERPPGIPPSAIAMPIPPYVRSIRIGDGVVTLQREAR